MQIECPKCKQHYSIDESLIGEDVECVACGHVFVAQETAPIVRRIFILIEQQEWSKAREYCEKVLESEPENSELYLMMCLIEHKISKEEMLVKSNCDLSKDKNFSIAVRFASGKRKQHLLDILAEQKNVRMLCLSEIQKKNKERKSKTSRIAKNILKVFLIIVCICIALLVFILSYREIEFRRGVSAYKTNNYASAALHLRNANKFGHNLDSDMKVFLGKCYYTGEGVIKDYPEALDLFWWPAQYGNPEAQYYIGKCYYYHNDADYSTNIAIDFFRKAAEQGFADAQFELGKFYYDFNGYPAPGLPTMIPSFKYQEDVMDRLKREREEQRMYILREAISWFRKAAAQGHSEAQFYLGKCYENGEGVERNLIEANKWYRRAKHEDIVGLDNTETKDGLLPNIKSIVLADGIVLELIEIETNTSDAKRKSEHDFYIGKTEVTQAQWKSVMGNNPAYNRSDNCPVEYVSWSDAIDFCNKLNNMRKAPDGWKFTLPTEKQWEYAARGGIKDQGFEYNGYDTLDEIAWYAENSKNYNTHPVGQKKPNELGLYDMIGNVQEWCLDEDAVEIRPYYIETIEDFSQVKTIPRWIARGGCTNSISPNVATRSSWSDDTQLSNIGFRLALVKK